MAARISIADLSDATGIPAELLAAEITALQRDSQSSWARARPPAPADGAAREPVTMGETPKPPAQPVPSAAAPEDDGEDSRAAA